jgi:HemY protein
MKGIFGWLALAAVAVALALLMGQNHASVTLFWSPHRIDVSFNLALFGLLLLFGLFYAALRAGALLRQLPERARRWRGLQRERAAMGAVFDALALHMAGRFKRANTAAQHAIGQLHAMQAQPAFVQREQALVLAQWLAAESAHSLGDAAQRDQWLHDIGQHLAPTPEEPMWEAVQLRAVRWALDDRDAQAAQERLAALTPGAARRILSVRLKLQLARLQHDAATAIDAARALAKHHASPPDDSAGTALHDVMLEAVQHPHQPAQVLQLWADLPTPERHRPDWALAVADRWRQLREQDPAHEPSVQEWRLYQDLLQTLWRDYADLNASAQQRLVAHLQAAWPQLDENWLGQIDALQREHPGNPGLHYLAGLLCRQRQQPDAASQHLSQAGAALIDATLRRRAWRAVAELAHERGDTAAALAAWQQAAQD